MPPRNSKTPTTRPSRRGPVSLAINEVRNLFIARGLVDESKWNDEIDRLLADQYQRWLDHGARMASETNRVRELEDEVRELTTRVKALEVELKAMTKRYNEARRGGR